MKLVFKSSKIAENYCKSKNGKTLFTCFYLFISYYIKEKSFLKVSEAQKNIENGINRRLFEDSRSTKNYSKSKNSKLVLEISGSPTGKILQCSIVLFHVILRKNRL